MDINLIQVIKKVAEATFFYCIILSHSPIIMRAIG